MLNFEVVNKDKHEALLDKVSQYYFSGFSGEARVLAYEGESGTLRFLAKLLKTFPILTKDRLELSLFKGLEAKDPSKVSGFRQVASLLARVYDSKPELVPDFVELKTMNYGRSPDHGEDTKIIDELVESILKDPARIVLVSEFSEQEISKLCEEVLGDS